MSSKKPGIHRRDFLGGSSALAGATVLGGFARGASAQAARTEIVFASAPFLSIEAIDELLAAYNSSQNAVHATFLELPNAADPVALHADLVKRLQGPEGAPDIYSLDIVRIAEFAAAGLASPLAEDFAASEMQAFFPGVVAGCTVGGVLTAMPWFVDCGMLFYRKDILEKIGADVPETWDDLASAATKGIEDGTPNGLLWQGKKSEALVCNVVSVVGSNGGTILAPDGVTVKIAEPEAVEAVRFLYDAIESKHISPPEVRTWDEEPSRKPFQEGGAVFLRNWSYTWGLAQQEGSPIAGKIGVAPLPHFAGNQSAACLGGYQYAVNAASKNKEAAIDVLRWLSGAETQLRFAVANGLAPTRPSVFDEPVLAEAQPFLGQLKGVFAGALSRPVTPKYPDVTLAIQSAVASALKTGEIETTLADAKDKIEAIVKS